MAYVTDRERKKKLPVFNYNSLGREVPHSILEVYIKWTPCSRVATNHITQSMLLYNKLLQNIQMNVVTDLRVTDIILSNLEYK